MHLNPADPESRTLLMRQLQTHIENVKQARTLGSAEYSEGGLRGRLGVLNELGFLSDQDVLSIKTEASLS